MVIGTLLKKKKKGQARCAIFWLRDTPSDQAHLFYKFVAIVLCIEDSSLLSRAQGTIIS